MKEHPQLGWRIFKFAQGGLWRKIKEAGLIRSVSRPVRLRWEHWLRQRPRVCH